MSRSSLVKWRSPLDKLKQHQGYSNSLETNNNAVLPHDLNLEANADNIQSAAPAGPSHADNIEALQSEAIAKVEANNLEEGQEHVVEWGLDEEENANPNP